MPLLMYEDLIDPAWLEPLPNPNSMCGWILRPWGGGGGAVRLRPDMKSGGGGGGGGGAARFRPDTKSEGGGGGCCPFKARYEKRRGGGGGGGVLSGASGPIQKMGKGEGLVSRRGGVTIYERGGCTYRSYFKQTPTMHLSHQASRADIIKALLKTFNWR